MATCLSDAWSYSTTKGPAGTADLTGHFRDWMPHSGWLMVWSVSFSKEPLWRTESQPQVTNEPFYILLTYPRDGISGRSSFIALGSGNLTLCLEDSFFSSRRMSEFKVGGSIIRLISVLVHPWLAMWETCSILTCQMDRITINTLQSYLGTKGDKVGKMPGTW